MRRFKLFVDRGSGGLSEDTVTLADLGFDAEPAEDAIDKALADAVDLMISNEVDAGWSEVDE